MLFICWLIQIRHDTTDTFLELFCVLAHFCHLPSWLIYFPVLCVWSSTIHCLLYDVYTVLSLKKMTQIKENFIKSIEILNML